MNNLYAHNLGYPRMGENRELKRSLEAYWRGKIERSELLKTAADVRRQNWATQKE